MADLGSWEPKPGDWVTVVRDGYPSSDLGVLECRPATQEEISRANLGQLEGL